MKTQPAHEERLRRMAAVVSTQHYRNKSPAESRGTLSVQTVVNNPVGFKINIGFKKGTTLAALGKKEIVDIRMRRRLKYMLSASTGEALKALGKIEGPLMKWIASKQSNTESFFLDPVGAIEKLRLVKNTAVLRMIQGTFRKMSPPSATVEALPIASIKFVTAQAKKTAKPSGRSGDSAVKKGRQAAKKK